jgi:hypothetical protein
VTDRVELQLDVAGHSDELRTIVPNATERFDGDRVGGQHVGQVKAERRRDLSAGHEQVGNVRVSELPCHCHRSNSVLLQHLDPAFHASDEWQDRSQTPASSRFKNPTCFLEVGLVRSQAMRVVRGMTDHGL